MKFHTPLAWKNLTHDLRRLAVAVSGVGFAVILIFMQLGFLNALLESTVQLIRRLDGEVLLMSSVKYAIPAAERFKRQRVQEAAELVGVRAAYPVYLETLAVLRQFDERGHAIRAMAFVADDPVLDGTSLRTLAPQLLQPAAALTDVTNRKAFGIPAQNQDLPEYRAELSGKQIKLVGQFRLGVDFATDGNLLMTAKTFAEFFPMRVPGGDPLSMVDLAVIQVEEGVDPVKVRKALNQSLPADVRAFTKDELIDREMAFWRTSAPVGYIFLVGVYMGFVVGVIICYQIIYTDIAEHMSEFATLKAMGYTRGYFLRLVLAQAVYLSFMGFVPGLLVSYGCYALLSKVTGLTMQLTLPLAMTVLAVTLLMCVVSGALALRKLLAMDPADLF